MDAGELDEESSCNNLSGSDVSNESGREYENAIDPGTSTGSVDVSRCRALISATEIDRDSCEESDETRSCVSEGNESKSKENSLHGNAPKRAKISQKSANTE